jgi:hypothetical protein
LKVAKLMEPVATEHKLIWNDEYQPNESKHVNSLRTIQFTVHDDDKFHQIVIWEDSVRYYPSEGKSLDTHNDEEEVMDYLKSINFIK